MERELLHSLVQIRSSSSKATMRRLIVTGGSDSTLVLRFRVMDLRLNVALKIIICGPVFERKGMPPSMMGSVFVESLRRLQEIAIDLDVSHLPKRVQDGSSEPSRPL